MDSLLSEKDRATLHGEHGPAARMAMTVLVRMLPVFGAERFLDITAAHIDSTLFQGDATLEYAERLASLGARVVVPATLNVSGVDEHGWGAWHVPAEWAEKARRQMVAYQSMGCTPTWTCAPYQQSERPRLGQQIAWGESSAVIFANSVLGARTERYPDLLDICAAITGRAPAAGLHLEENRAGQVLFQLRRVPQYVQEDDGFYGVLGHLVGKEAGEAIPVIEGIEAAPTEDQLKALGAAMASSGVVALFHLVGVTPEAPTREAAFQGRSPDRSMDVTMDMLRAARRDLTTAQVESLDLVALGSPHFSLDEFRKLAPLVAGLRRHEDVRFVVTASRAIKALAARMGYMEAIESFGGTVTVDTCILTTPMLSPDVRTVMTNSPKYAYYAPGLLGTQVVFGALEDCVLSAVEGRVIQREGVWCA